MKVVPKRLLAGAGAFAIAAGLTLGTAGVAFAAHPSYEPDANSAGPLTLTDATGKVITSGSTADSPISAFAVGSTFGHASGDNLATLYLCTPIASTPSGAWNCDQMSSSTAFATPPSGAALPTGVPFVTGAAGDTDVADIAADIPNGDASDPGVYQLRLVTSGPGQAGNVASHFDSLDIVVSGSTWTAENWPDPATADTTTTVVTSTLTSPQNSPTAISVPLKATVTPLSTPTGTGPIGSVQFFNGGVQVGATQLTTSTPPYTATVSASLLGDASYTAVFTPYNGTSLQGSTSAAFPFHVGPPNTSTSTTLAANPTTYDNDGNNTYDATVTIPSGDTCAGSVSIIDNTTTTVAGPIAVSPGTANECIAHLVNVFTTAGSHSVVATFTPAAGSPLQGSSSSPPVTFTQADKPADCASAGATGSGQCTDDQTITGTIPAGTLVIHTPYTATSPLPLGTLALSTDSTYFTGNAQFGAGTTNTAGDILITDTRAGDLGWTAEAQAQTLTGATVEGGPALTGPGSTIDGQNVGLTNLTTVTVPGNGFDRSAGNYGTTDVNAASPPVAAGTAGDLGLGNEAHKFAEAQHGFGSIAIYGTLTLNAPSSTQAGFFTGTITFTIVGSAL
jgi:hypothetical protein